MWNKKKQVFGHIWKNERTRTVGVMLVGAGCGGERLDVGEQLVEELTRLVEDNLVVVLVDERLGAHAHLRVQREQLEQVEQRQL